MLDVKALLAKILDALKTDYIVEEGTSGIWTYRKWNSGIAECWGYKTISTTFASWGSWYYISVTGENYPTGLFTLVTSVQGQLTVNDADTISSIVRRPNDMKVTAPNITGIRPTSAAGTYTGYGYWHTVGKWK